LFLPHDNVIQESDIKNAKGRFMPFGQGDVRRAHFNGSGAMVVGANY
jgi:hypothetical protein